MNYMEQLAHWWSRQCDGEWEHEFGISVQTMDDPGWLVKIDLTFTDSYDVDFARMATNRAERDWFECRVAKERSFGTTEDGDKCFVGVGGPVNLGDIVDHFLKAVGERK